MIRPAGANITNNGTSDGVVPFCKIYDSTILATNQGSVRRGAASVNINIEHDDFEEWLEIREPKGDVNRQSLNLHQCAVVGDKFMRKLTSGDTDARRKWSKLLQKRKATGEPYILFKGNTNKQNPAAYKDNALKVHMTNICSEIVLHTDENHSFVCCLSSLNLAKYDEWKNTNIIYDSIWFLDGVLEEFIQKAKGKIGFANSVRSAEKGRALGLGVLGWHSLLQSQNLAFNSKEAFDLNSNVFRFIKERSYQASEELAKMFGEPQVLKGYGRRNATLNAIAPTTSSAFILGQVSQGIEPIWSNIYVKDIAKIKTTIKNPFLVDLLEEKGKNTTEVWHSIRERDGSVQHLDFLSENEKNVFKTYSEIDQMDIIYQAANRQVHVDQGQSVNLMVHPDMPIKDINNLYVTAWKLGLKSLYYQHSMNAAQKFKQKKDCVSCEA